MRLGKYVNYKRFLSIHTIFFFWSPVKKRKPRSNNNENDRISFERAFTYSSNKKNDSYKKCDGCKKNCLQ